MFANHQYFARKAFLETTRAAKAKSDGVKRWHQELADKYAGMAKTLQDAAA